MAAFDPSDVEVISRDDAVLLIRWENVLVQYRYGELTADALRHVVSVARLVRTRLRGPVGLFGFIAGGAPVPSPEVRGAQRQLIKAMMSDERSYICVVSAGESTMSGLLRTTLRLIIPGFARVHVAEDVESGARWLAERVERSERDLLALAAYTKTVAEEA